MIELLKSNVRKSTFLKKLFVPVYEFYVEMVFSLYHELNLKISYQLVNKSKVQFFPKGQIAKGLFLHQFEKNELEVFQSLMANGSVLIDAGANIGLYSIIGSKLAGKNGRVYSFEPSKGTFKLFLKNIELNSATNITAINKGLGDIIGESLVLKHNSENDDAENFISRSETKTDQQIAVVSSSELITIDTLDNFQQVNKIDKVDFLKIDVEGYEYYVLKGAENLLKNNPDIIILFECADHLAKRAGSNQREVFNLLGTLGFEIAQWDEKEKKWICDNIDSVNSGQFLGGKNLMTALNKIYLNHDDEE